MVGYMDGGMHGWLRGLMYGHIDGMTLYSDANTGMERGVGRGIEGIKTP